MEFVQDSFDYLGDARELLPGVIRPLGYPMFLRVLSVTGRLDLVPVIQHLMALTMAVAIYLLLRRRSAGPHLAALATAPLLLDAYQVYLEQFILAETLFEFMMVSAVVVLLWRTRPGPLACGVAGALLAASALTRTVGLVLLVPAIGYLVARRVGVRSLVGFAAPVVVLLGAYAGWYEAVNGRLGFQSFDGYFLAGRVAPFGDCGGLAPPAEEQRLCDHRPVAERPGPDWYVWNPASPLRDPDVAPGADRNQVAGSFARRTIAHQPGDYLHTVASDVLHYFSPVRTGGPKDGLAQTFQFRTTFSPDPWQTAHPPDDPYIWQWTWPGSSVQHGNIVATHGFDLAQVKPSLHEGIAQGLRAYQRIGYTPGPLLAGAVLVGLAGALGRRRRRPRGEGWSIGLLISAGMTMLVVPAATASFDFRYLLPALPLLPAAGVLGIVHLRRSREPSRDNVVASPTVRPGRELEHRPSLGQFGNLPTVTVREPVAVAREADHLGVLLDHTALGDRETVMVSHRELSRLQAVVAKPVAARCHLPSALARRAVTLGRDLRPMPELEAAWLAGAIRDSHLSLLAAARSHNPGCFTRDERMLVGYAKDLRYAQFVRALSYWVQLAHPNGAEEPAADDYARRRFHLSRGLEGKWFADATFDPIGGSIDSKPGQALFQEAVLVVSPGQVEGPLVRGAGLVGAPQPAEQFGPRRVEVLIVVEREALDQLQGGFGPVHLGHGHGPVELGDRRAGETNELGIEGGDLWPVNGLVHLE